MRHRAKKNHPQRESGRTTNLSRLRSSQGEHDGRQSENDGGERRGGRKRRERSLKLQEREIEELVS